MRQTRSTFLPPIVFLVELWVIAGIMNMVLGTLLEAVAASASVPVGLTVNTVAHLIGVLIVIFFTRMIFNLTYRQARNVAFVIVVVYGVWDLFTLLFFYGDLVMLIYAILAAVKAVGTYFLIKKLLPRLP